MSDKTNARIGPVERATNRSWDEWLQFMESIDAKSLDHHEIAVKVYYELEGKIENLGWWTQAVTVAYEQYIGRRIPGQRPDGTFQTSVSKATALGMQQLMDEWVAFAANQPEIEAMAVQEARVGGTENRLSWRTKATDGSVINVLSEPKANGTASLVVQHMGMESFELNQEAKEKWTEIVARFVAGLPAPTEDPSSKKEKRETGAPKPKMGYQ